MPYLDHLSIRKILLRSTNWIGDAVMTTPAMDAVRSTFPQAEVVVVANPIVAELFTHHPFCDRVVVYDKKGVHSGISGFLRFSRQLKEEEFDLALLFQNAIEAALMARIASIPIRAGYRTDGRGFLLTHGVPVGRKERRLHHTDYYLTMLEKLGIDGGSRRLFLALAEDEKSWAEGVLGEGAWAAINPGAAYGSAKRWIPERFAAVADAMTLEFGMRTLLTGGPGEREIGLEIEKHSIQKPINMIGKTSVRQMMALLAHCRIMITNDSGPMHVAAAMGTPVVALFGSTDHTTTSPLSENCQIVRKPIECAPCLKRQCPTDHRCMEAITVEDVVMAARDILS
jgi:heptosyltransferase II